MFIEFDKALEDIGFGKYHYWMFYIGGTVSVMQSWLEDMMTTTSVSVVLATVGDLWDISDTLKGILGATFTFGMFIGSYVCGYLADRKGRMYPFKRTMLLLIISSAIILASVNVYMLAFGLFFYGMAAGGEVTMGGVVFQEFCPPSKKHLLVVLSLTWCLGAVITALVVSLLMVCDLPIDLRRSLSIFNIVVGIIFFVSRLRIPETPRYLIAHGRNEEAYEVLRMICRVNGKTIPLEMGKLSEEVSAQSPLIEVKPSGVSFAKLWDSQNFRATILFTLTYSLANFGFGFLALFMPDLLSEAGVSGVYIYLTMAIQQSAGIPGILLGSKIVDSRCGRKYTIVFGFLISALFNLGFIFARSYALIVVFTSLGLMMNYMAWGVMYTITPESYRTSVRNFGNGWANACAKVGGIIGPLVGGAVLDVPNGFYICIMMACLMTVGVSFFALFLRETKGRNLD